MGFESTAKQNTHHYCKCDVSTKEQFRHLSIMKCRRKLPNAFHIHAKFSRCSRKFSPMSTIFFFKKCTTSVYCIFIYVFPYIHLNCIQSDLWFILFVMISILFCLYIKIVIAFMYINIEK